MTIEQLRNRLNEAITRNPGLAKKQATILNLDGEFNTIEDIAFQVDDTDIWLTIEEV